MITITRGNSYSKLNGLNRDQEKAVSKALSYTVGGSSAFFGRDYARQTSLLSKTGEFPSGLLIRVLMELVKYGVTIDDTRFKPLQSPHHMVLSGKAYPWQDLAVETAIRTESGIITAPTGTGKSRCMAMLIAKLGMKTLVVVPSLEIRRQLQQTFKEFRLKNVRVENIDSTTLNHFKDFDCLIIDEAHHTASKTYRKLNKKMWNGIYYRFFFTATPFRNDSEEQLLFESIAGRIIYKLDYIEAIEKGYIVPVEAYYLDIPKQATDAVSYREVYNELVVNHSLRNETIAELLLTLNSVEKSTLCLVREVKHGQILSGITGLPFVSGIDDDSRDYIRQFNSGEIKVLIGTTGILGEGIDTKPCEYVVIAGLGKAKSQLMQQVGRGVRTFPGKESAKIILIQDRSHKFLSRHFKAQSAILQEEYGVLPVKLGVNK